MFGISDLVMGGISAAASLFGRASDNEAAAERQNQSNAFNAQQAEINREFTSAQAVAQRDFQERMSSTAYSRATTDMRNAGLNPILAAGGNAASTPAGAMGQSSAASSTPHGPEGSGVGEALQKGVSTAQQSRALAAQNDLIKEDLAKREKETTNVAAQTKTQIAQANVLNEEAKNKAVDNQIKTHLVAVAAKDAARATTEKDYAQSLFGKYLQLAGHGGSDISRIVAPIGSLVGSAKGVSNILPNRTTIEKATSDGKSSFEEIWRNRFGN